MAIKTSDPCAGPISYNNAELLYAYTDYDNFSDNGSGALLRIEYSAWDNLYLACDDCQNKLSNRTLAVRWPKRPNCW